MRAAEARAAELGASSRKSRSRARRAGWVEAVIVIRDVGGERAAEVSEDERVRVSNSEWIGR